MKSALLRPCDGLSCFLVLLASMCAFAAAEAADATSDGKQKAKPGEAISPATARKLAKDEVAQAEAKVAQNVDLYDPVKLRAARDKLTSLQNHPDLVKMRNELASVLAKPAFTEEQHEKAIQLQQGLWEKEKALLLAENPEFKEIVEGRERINKELMRSLAAKKARPEVMKAAVEDMKAREEARAKDKQAKE